MERQILIAAALVLVAAQCLAGPARSPPPLPSHPGNVFLTGEKVVIPVEERAGTFRLLDYEGKLVAKPKAAEGHVELGKLPAGYYELRSDDESQPVSLAVIERLRAPTPARSPIGIDVAMAWFYPREKMDQVASLCALAGVNHVRDRLAWGEIEPERGRFAANTRYDASAQAQSAAGLRLLQVNHSSPRWANPQGKRFPLDLRDTYTLHRELSRRWNGQVLAFEPWNEADIGVFGGHTGSEMASLQKAAFLGVKAGNPRAIACLNVFAIHRASTLSDLQDNVAWPYFDTFNLHHYEKFDAYSKLYADFRAVSAGKPLWVSECSVPVKWTGDERVKEPTAEDLRVQSERLPIVFALSIHEGSEAVFYFMLPHYVEGQTQFGIIHSNLTPRPAFLALAAAGRFLAGARPLGRVQDCDSSVHAFVFAAEPDGKPARVLVAWSDRDTALPLPKSPVACFDHLGRSVPVIRSGLKVGHAPVYAILPASAHLKVAPPPERPALLPGSPCSIVLQALAPENVVDLEKSAYKMETGESAEFPLNVYNFGERACAGTLRVTGAPDGWRVDLASSEIRVTPADRAQLILKIEPTSATNPVKLRITGDFGDGGHPVLSVRFVTVQKRP